MKKIFAFLAAFAALTSCSVKELDSPERPAGSPVLHASFEDTDITRTFVDDGLHLFWTADDRLSVFLGTTYNQQYRFMGETGDNAGDFEEVPASGLHSGSDVNAIYAVYPYQSATKLSYDGKITVELPTVQQYASGTFGLGANTMVAVTADKSDTFLPFKNVCGYLVVKLYGSGSVNSVTIEGNNGEKLAGRATVTASYGAAPSLSFADDATTSITIDCGDGVKLGSTAETATEFWFCIPPVMFSKGFTVTATGSAGSFSKSTTVSRTIERNVRVSMPALEFIPEAVDLGLPSGLKWASCNLGASKPEDCGGYYQWAGLEDVTDTRIYLDWSNCPYHTGSDEHSGWTKYVPSGKPSYWSGLGSPDNKTALDPEDDVAHVTLGGKWRMPTKAEFEELKNNCTSEQTTLNRVKGRKFTSKKNGNSIFLPATGYRNDDYRYDVGSFGHYWSSSRSTFYPYYAYFLFFYSDYVSTDGYYRYYGHSVRPVYGDKVSVTGVSLSKTSLNLVVGAVNTLSATVSPSSAAEQSVGWSSNNPTVATVDAIGKVTALKTGSATITVKTTDGGYTASCQVTVVSAGPAVPEAVDLGLPSGLKWASFNLGASAPEDYGGYYQWAGLEDVTSTSIYLNWSNCPYCSDSDGNKWTKYIPSGYSSRWSGSGSPDNKTVLDPEDDVAHVMLGGKWRMPTITEFEELYNNCTSEWTTLNGVKGRKFTSKKNGNCIFLPAAGYRNYDILYNVGSSGCFWSSSSLSTDYPADAYGLCFSTGGVSTNDLGRCSGRSVRPVYGDKVSVTGVSLSKTSLNLVVGAVNILSATVTPSSAAEQSVSWSSNNPTVATVDAIGKVTALKTGSATITVKTTDGGYTATCSVTVRPSDGADTEPAVPEAVDLGLPSGLKWASFNLGASAPEDYGGYYQWAGLEDVTDTRIYLDCSNCPYHTGSDEHSCWTKYIPSGYTSYWSGSGSPDNKTVLDPEDDVAHVSLGGKWRMPTRAEFEELCNNCTSEWTTLNGVKGRKFTSKKNSNCIFLPAAGFRYYGSLRTVGSYGLYWSSSLDTGYPYLAYELHFGAGYVYTYDGSGRYYGLSVRPVSE